MFSRSRPTIYVFLFVVLVLVSRAVTPGNTIAGPDVDSAAEFPGILSARGAPAASEDWSFAPFSDNGAWMGFALPPEDTVDEASAFSGPFLMPEGRWLSPQLATLEIFDVNLEEELTMSGAAKFRSGAYPGSLRREYMLGELRVVQTLWFDSAQTALIRVQLFNTGTAAREFELAWTGAVFSDASLEAGQSSVVARSQSGATVRIRADRPNEDVAVTRRPPGETSDSLVTRTTGHRYRLRLADRVFVGPGRSINFGLAVTLTLKGDPEPGKAEIRKLLSNLDGAWTRNLERWNRYLDAIDTGRPNDDPVQVLAVKSLITLVNNWRGPAGRMQHSGLFPSSNVWYFNGFWAWDSWKHAVGILCFDPELAAEQVRAMFDHQNESGMIADVVYLNPVEDNWRDTKPPLAGWAIETVYDVTGDVEFVRDLYPKLVAYHRFWYTDRDHDGDGLCEYGSTDGTLVAARWESGMDNAVRFDSTQMLQNGPDAWSMNQESVDLNSYLYREKLALARLASGLDRNEEAARWTAEADKLKDRIQTDMYDGSTGWFYDIDVNSGAFVRVQGPEGWIPLWAGVASDEQASRVRDTMLDPEKFRTHVPFPTVARDDPGFSDGYWRGLVWLDQAWFAIEGLRRYGYETDATALRDQLFKNLEGATVAGVPLRENYHPLTGAGQNVKHFSWTAAHLLLLTQSPPVTD